MHSNAEHWNERNERKLKRLSLRAQRSGAKQSQDMGLLHYAVASYPSGTLRANAMTNMFLPNWDAPHQFANSIRTVLGVIAACPVC
jgi:hypothetical protein